MASTLKRFLIGSPLATDEGPTEDPHAEGGLTDVPVHEARHDEPRDHINHLGRPTRDDIQGHPVTAGQVLAGRSDIDLSIREFKRIVDG